MKTVVNYTHESKSEAALSMMREAINQTYNATSVRWGLDKVACVETLICNIGSTESNSNIYLADHNGYAVAYFMNGLFWSAVTKSLITIN